MRRDEQPILLADCPDCHLSMTYVIAGGITWPTCVCCGGAGLARDRGCTHHRPELSA